MMRNHAKKITAGLTSAGLLVLPLVAFAQIVNPLPGITSVTDVIVTVISWVLGVSAVISVFAVIIAGVRMVLSFGKDDDLRKAKEMMLWAVIGLAVILTSYSVIAIIVQIFGIQI